MMVLLYGLMFALAAIQLATPSASKLPAVVRE